MARRMLFGVLFVALLAAAKLACCLTDTPCELGQLLGAEYEEHHRENDEQFGRPNVHAQLYAPPHVSHDAASPSGEFVGRSFTRCSSSSQVRPRRLGSGARSRTTIVASRTVSP